MIIRKFTELNDVTATSSPRGVKLRWLKIPIHVHFGGNAHQVGQTDLVIGL